MTDDSPQGEFHRNIWAPWRREYVASLAEPIEGCFFCHHAENPDDDAAHWVLWRAKHHLVLLNRFPYTAGHAMIAPYRHVDSLADLSPEAMCEMLELARDLQRLLAETVHCEGFNVGMNFGRCAGAGLPGHLHLHVVPRWVGDANVVPILGGVRVISQSLDELFAELLAAAKRLGLPRLSARE
jgi:ATP adenylyltransferase